MEKVVYSYIEKLREAKNNNKLVVFVGSGVSMNSGYITWKDLIKEMYGALKGTDVLKANDSIILNNTLKIPQLLFEKDKNKYYEIIRNNFPDKKSNVLNNKIFELMPKHIITTNYDKLLENSDNPYVSFYDVVTTDKQLLQAQKPHYILKMHGTIDDVNTIVLKEDDYFRYQQEHPAFETFIKSLLLDHTFLFLGYSLSDLNLKLILGWISSLKIQLKGEFENKYYILTDNIDDELDIDLFDYFNNNGVVVINYKSLEGNLSKNSECLGLHPKARTIYSLCNMLCSNNDCLYEFIKHYIDLISEDEYVDYGFITKFLLLEPCIKLDTTLEIVRKQNFLILKELLDSDLGDKINNLLYRAKIYYIVCDELSKEQICIHMPIELKKSFRENLFIKFIEFDYNSMYRLLSKTKDSFSKFYYENLFNNFFVVGNRFKEIKLDNIDSKQDILSYYVNNNFSNQLRADNDAERLNLQNVLSSLSQFEQVKYSYFKNVEDCFNKQINSLQKNLNDIEKNYLTSQQTIFNLGGALNPLYKMKAISYNIVEICFQNNIILNKFSNLKTLLYPYISAMICTNTKKIENEIENASYDVFNVKLENYTLNSQDVAILCNFISNKDLNELLKKYCVEEISIDCDIIKQFTNLWKSIKLKLVPYNQDIIEIFFNFIILFTHLNLNKEELKITNKVLKEAFQEDKLTFIILKDVNYYQSNILTNYLKKYEDSLGASFKKLIGEKVINYCIKRYKENKVDFKDLYQFKQYIKFDKKSLEELLNIYKGLQDKDKMTVGIDFYIYMDKNFKNDFKKLVNANYGLLNTREIMNTYSLKILELNPEQSFNIVERANKIINQKEGNVHYFPNPKDAWIELLCILRLWGKLYDSNNIDPYITDKDYYQFIFAPETFKSYDKIDLRHYMWENIIRSKNYDKYLLTHKKDILNSFNLHKDMDTAGEVERKFIYKYMLTDKEIWDNKY